MRTTRAAAAVARLNRRCPDQHHVMVLLASGLLKLHERTAAGDQPRSEALALDDFVALVDALGPQKEVRISKSEAAFALQLSKKPRA